MSNYKNILAILAIVVGFTGYAPYLKNLIIGKTKPHAFSWLAWALLEGTAFFAQIAKGGGVGAYITGFSALVALFVATVAFYRKETEIKFFDWVAFGGAIVGIVFWAVTKNPLTAVLLVTVSDFLAFVPTFRKAYHVPDQETLIEYGLSAIKWILAILALSSYSFTTWLYPASLILSNGSFTILSLVRKKQLGLK